jgi:PDZ domain-containing secreted protein
MVNIVSSSLPAPGFFNARSITGVVFKKTDDERLGIGFRDSPKDGVILGSLQMRFEKETDLVSGLKVLHVNGTPVESANHAATLIRSVSAGQPASVVVDGVCVQVTKKKRYEKAGLSLESVEGTGVRIAQVDGKGYCSSSLYPGQTLVAINGEAVNTVKDATRLLGQFKTLKLVVVTDDEDASISCRSIASNYTAATCVTDELELLEPVHFQMQDFEEDYMNTPIAECS